jgi:hypothetical protein
MATVSRMATLALNLRLLILMILLMRTGMTSPTTRIPVRKILIRIASRGMKMAMTFPMTRILVPTIPILNALTPA